jgi:hypothetical protein
MSTKWSRTQMLGATVGGVLLLCPLLAGCGASGADSPSEAELARARSEGERVAGERARVDELEEEVRSLKRQARRPRAELSGPMSQPPDLPEEGVPQLLRSFHAPSGNVSCAITGDGAFCTVDSIGTTFRVEGDSPGQIESGATLPQGFGELAGYGSSVSAGPITCTVPAAAEPRGIVCTNSNSGHGFEASRVGGRQKAF